MPYLRGQPSRLVDLPLLLEAELQVRGLRVVGDVVPGADPVVLSIQGRVAPVVGIGWLGFLIVAPERTTAVVVVVSHDEYFLSSLCDKLYVVNKGSVKYFDGDLAAYRRQILKKI